MTSRKSLVYHRQDNRVSVWVRKMALKSDWTWLRKNNYTLKLEMWANAQRDARAAEYRCSMPQSLAHSHY